MACNNSCGNDKIQKGIDNVRAQIASGKLEITPAVINNDIRLLGGSITTMAAPVEIDSDRVTGPYGETYPVFPLRMLVCGDGTFTRHIDWRGLEPGVTYLTNKGFLKVTANKEITDKMAANPLSKIINAGVLDIKYLGGRDAEWEERDREIIPAGRTDFIPVKETTEDEAKRTYKSRAERLREALRIALGA